MKSSYLKKRMTNLAMTLLLLVSATICVAQDHPVPVSNQVQKTYNSQNQSIVEWDESMEVQIKETPVLEVYEENKNLPDIERREQTKIITDLMREAREGISPE